MSGHSKWSKVKHQKAVTDVVKAKQFTQTSHGITIAVREGGGVTDPTMNFRLRLAIEKAKAVNMPKENIDRAIDKASGVGATRVEEAFFEGFGPGGSSFLIEAVTDNRQRTVSTIKNLLERAGGTLAGPGAVAHGFERLGLIVISHDRSMDDMMIASLDAGASDIAEYDDIFELYTKPTVLMQVKDSLERHGIAISDAQLVYRPFVSIDIGGAIKEKVDDLVSQLEASDDISAVYTNIL